MAQLPTAVTEVAVMPAGKADKCGPIVTRPATGLTEMEVSASAGHRLRSRARLLSDRCWLRSPAP